MIFAQADPATNISTNHLAIMIAGGSFLLATGQILIGVITRKKDDASIARQSLECRFEHQTLATVVDRIEHQGEAVLETQRNITSTLDRVAGVLDRISEKLDDQKDKRRSSP